MLISLTFIIYTSLTDINHSFLKTCAAFQARPSLCRPAKPVGIAIFSNSDGGSCWSMGMARSWQKTLHMCMQKNQKKPKQPTKQNRKFRQSLSPASKPRSAAPAPAAAPHRGMEEDAGMERTGVQPPGSPHTSLPRGLPEGLPPPPGSVGGSRGDPGIAGRGRSRVNGRALAAPRPRPRQSAPAAASAAMTI